MGKAKRAHVMEMVRTVYPQDAGATYRNCAEMVGTALCTFAHPTSAVDVIDTCAYSARLTADAALVGWAKRQRAHVA